MRVAKHAAAVFGELGENRKLFGREVHRLAILRHPAMEKIDCDPVQLDRLLVAVLPKLDEVGDVAVKL